MSRVVAKMFISTYTEGPDGSGMYDLGAVCRGEINKDWAAATPSGTAKLAACHDLDAAWETHKKDSSIPAEVLVFQTPNPDGEFELRSCEFAYNGCKVTFLRQSSGAPYGQKLELTINAHDATRALREAFAGGLLSGTAPRFDITVEMPLTDES